MITDSYILEITGLYPYRMSFPIANSENDIVALLDRHDLLECQLKIKGIGVLAIYNVYNSTDESEIFTEWIFECAYLRPIEKMKEVEYSI